MTKTRTIKTPEGEAVYEQAGNCADCGAPVYGWKSGPAKYAHELGNVVAVFYNMYKGQPPEVRCQACHKKHVTPAAIR